jgi:hypothetical protein
MGVFGTDAENHHRKLFYRLWTLYEQFLYPVPVAVSFVRTEYLATVSVTIQPTLPVLDAF